MEERGVQKPCGGARYKTDELSLDTSRKFSSSSNTECKPEEEIKAVAGAFNTACGQSFLQQSPDSLSSKGRAVCDPWHLGGGVLTCFGQSFLQQSFACASEIAGEMGINRAKANNPKANFLNAIRFIIKAYYNEGRKIKLKDSKGDL